MTIPQPKTAVGAAAASQKPEAIWVDATVRVIAAGVRGGKARATLVLTPILASGTSPSEAFDLNAWPLYVAHAVAGGVQVAVSPVKNSGTRPVPKADAKTVVMVPVRPMKKNEEDDLVKMWAATMGGDTGFGPVKVLLAKDDREATLTALKRPMETGGSEAPDIHGSARGEVAIALTLENAKHIIDRLACKPVDTRPAFPPASFSKLVADILCGIACAAGDDGDLVPGSKAARKLTKSEVRAELLGWKALRDSNNSTTAAESRRFEEKFRELEQRYEEEVAWKDLADSRARTDADVLAYDTYLKETDLKKAVAALKKRQVGCPEKPTPGQVAIKLRSQPNAGPALQEAHGAMRLSSEKMNKAGEPLKGDGNPVEQNPDGEFALRRLFALQAHPSLARLFQFVVDVECDADAFRSTDTSPDWFDEDNVLDYDHDSSKPMASEALPAPGKGQAGFVFLAATLTKEAVARNPRKIWTATKLRAEAANKPVRHFYPCAREEIDARLAQEPDLLGAAIVEQIDGIVHLGQSALCDAVAQPRFDIAALDTITSTAADMQFEKGRRQRTLMQERNRDLDEVDPAGGEGDPFKRATLRTGGLALIDRYRQRHAVTRYIVSAKQIGEASNAEPEKFPIVLDASDLTVGYRLDVGVKSDKQRRWHSLMNRDIVFGGEQDRVGGKTMDAIISSFYGDSRNERRHVDASTIAIPSALRQPGPDLTTTATRTTAFTEELVASWEGDPLGIACRADTLQVDPHDLQIGMVFSLPNRATGEAYVPPPLRFGWRYHFGLRAVWAGGISVPLERALGHYERSRQGTLALPAIRDSAAEGRAFRRHERLAEPMVAIPDWAFGAQVGNQGALKLPGRFVAEQAREMVIRKIQDPINKKLLQRNESDGPKEKDFSRRVLMVPSVSLAFAGLHDAFRAISRDQDIEQNVELLEPYFPAIDAFQNREPPLEGDAVECIETTQPDGDTQQRYIYWRKHKIASRPRGGLRGVDRRASWGGFPVYEKKTASGEGEIEIDDPRVVHRFVNGKKQSASKLTGAWHPLGGAPHGDAVFRALPGGARAQKERLPYYPDPAADALVISVTVAGRKNAYLQVPVYKGLRDKKLAHPRYPDALPLVLDVKPARSGQPLLGWAQGKTAGVWSYGADENLKPEATGSVAVHHVVVSLAPGEEATIQVWCLPGKLFLQYGFEPIESIAALCVACGCTSPTTDPATLDAACRDGFASLAGDGIELGAPGGVCGPAIGGLPLPTQAGIDAIAKKVETFMKTTPIPEVASPLTITATYAVDIPQEAPAYPQRAPAGAPPAVIRVNQDTRTDLLKTLTRDVAREKLQNWSLESTRDGATDVLLTGEVKLHAASTGAVEFIASGVAAARGRFDDVDRGRPRDSRLRGLWPEVSAENPIKTEDLFGFSVSGDGRVTHPQERVPLLRIEAFGAGGKVIDAFLAQRKMAGAADATADEPRKALRHEALTDGRARYLTIEPVAVARHGGLLRTRYDELMEQQSLAGQKSSLWLPTCVRPARIAPRSLIPSFSWSKLASSPASVSATRTTMVRARMRRPWFSSGEGERLGVVLWPPRLFSLKDDDVYNNIVRDLAPGRPGIDITKLPLDGLGGPTEFQDGDLGPGGSWVTRWGADPTRIGGDPHTGWLLSRNNFPQAKWPADPKSVKAKAGGGPLPALNPERDPFLPNDADWARAPADAPRDAALVQNVLMPLPSDEDDADKGKPVRFMTVALVTYEARFDAEREEWYADIEIDVPQAPWPFVRLGLVRFQPHAPRHLQVSEPVAEWIQLMPRREAQAVVEELGDTSVICVTVTGPASARGDHDVTPERASAQPPLMRVVLLQKGTHGGDRLVEAHEARIIRQGTPTVWEQRIKVPTAKLRNPELQHAVYVEEVERLRPTSYPDEPRRNTRNDEVFVETGPRFAVRLEVPNLKA